MTLSISSRNPSPPIRVTNKCSKLDTTFYHLAASLSFLKVPSDATIPSGSEKHTLFCSAFGHPKPHMIWYFNGKLPNYYQNATFQILDSEIHPATTKYDITDDALTIHDLKKSDSGIYTCEATNSMNTKTVSAKLSVTGKEQDSFIRE